MDYDDDSYEKDSYIANMLADQISKEIERDFKNPNFNKNYTHRAIHAYKQTDDQRECREYVSKPRCNEICLYDTFCDYDTLRQAVANIKVPDGYHYARFLEREVENGYITTTTDMIIFKDANKINYAEFPTNLKIWTTDSKEFRERFDNRNLDVKIDEYKRLKQSYTRSQRETEIHLEKLNNFKKDLTEEELLAISVIDKD